MKLITELTQEIEVLTEVKDNKKHFFIEGIFLQSELKNRNGRRYPKGVMESAVDKYMSKVEGKTAYGEFGHPEGPKINEERISHMTESLSWHGNNVIGKAKIFNRGLGAIAQGIIEDGGRLGVSSRGLGSLKNNSGIMEVQNDFWLATAADIVTDPSAPDAFVNGIMENVEWIQNAGGAWVSAFVESAQTEVHKTSKANLEEAKLRLFNNFMARIRG